MVQLPVMLPAFDTVNPQYRSLVLKMEMSPQWSEEQQAKAEKNWTEWCEFLFDVNERVREICFGASNFVPVDAGEVTMKALLSGGESGYSEQVRLKVFPEILSNTMPGSMDIVRLNFKDALVSAHAWLRHVVWRRQDSALYPQMLLYSYVLKSI
jgi:hypothetical protein